MFVESIWDYLLDSSVDHVVDSSVRRYNLDHIHLSQSPPPDRRPRYFQTTELSSMHNDSDSPDDDDYLNDEDLQHAVTLIENEYLSQIEASASVQNTQKRSIDSPDNDQQTISQTIMARLDLALKTTRRTTFDQDQRLPVIDLDQAEGKSIHSGVSTSSSGRPYPPVERRGVIHEHDRPFAEYGHLGTHRF